MWETIESTWYWSKWVIWSTSFTLFIIGHVLGINDFIMDITFTPIYHWIWPDAVATPHRWFMLVGIYTFFQLIPYRR